MVARTQMDGIKKLRGLVAEPLLSAPSIPGPEPTLNPAPTEAKRTGRPPAPEETMQISLRLPRAWLSALRREAVKASGAEDRTITPQEIVRRLVGQGLKVNG